MHQSKTRLANKMNAPQRGSHWRARERASECNAMPQGQNGCHRGARFFLAANLAYINSRPVCALTNAHPSPTTTTTTKRTGSPASAAKSSKLVRWHIFGIESLGCSVETRKSCVLGTSLNRRSSKSVDEQGTALLGFREVFEHKRFKHQRSIKLKHSD